MLEIAYLNKESDEVTIVKDTVTPKSKFPPDKYKKLYEIASVKLSDFASIHEAACPNLSEKKLQLSCDGVHENKSTQVSIDVYSLAFKNCNTIYPLKLIRPLCKHAVKNKEQLENVINDIHTNNFQISQFIGDWPKRSDAKEVKGHASWHACDYCFAKGVKIQVIGNSNITKKIEEQKSVIEEKIQECRSVPANEETNSKINSLLSLKADLQKSINAFKRRSHILWPFSTMTSQHRSRSSVMDIVNKIENNEILTLDQSKGIVGRSVLLDIPYYNYIYDTPAEYLHCSCLGVTKRLTELTFDIGTNRTRITKRKLSSSKDFNKLMLMTKVVREFSRRARSLDFAMFKGQEYRNLSMFFFPLVLECIEVDKKERNLWLNYAYMLRSAVVPTEEFDNISIEIVQKCCAEFYEIFEEIFGISNCTPNLHLFCSHLLEIRTHGPLTETSAFKYESFYGEMRRSFVPGTTSPLKQILKNVLLKRSLRKHQCVNSYYISNYETSLECNNLIYTYTGKSYKIFKVSEIDGSNITCNKIGQYPAIFNETPDIDWSTVGVFKRGGMREESTILNTSQIRGKVLNVGKYLVTCPANVLLEK